MEAIKVESLTKNYHKKRAIENVNLSVNEGELYGFIGPNGAGNQRQLKSY